MTTMHLCLVIEPVNESKIDSYMLLEFELRA